MKNGEIEASRVLIYIYILTNVNADCRVSRDVTIKCVGGPY